MFYRRKLILALLQAFGGNLKKINLQKLLFLVCDKQVSPVYDFVPYLYGCYSYSAKADLVAMVKKNFLVEDEVSYRKTGDTNYLTTLTEIDRKLVNQIFLLYNKMDSDGLMRHTYLSYPYYAINSKVAGTILSTEELNKVKSERPINNTIILFTIGYEGISLEAYLNKLLKHDVRVLVDVRNNPMSQKFGFSKSQLLKYCKSLGIEYLHCGEVGIQSEYRQELKSQSDYDNLFLKYRATTLKETRREQKNLLELLTSKKRIALTCYEADIRQCHRKHLAEAICELPDWQYELKHI